MRTMKFICGTCLGHGIVDPYIKSSDNAYKSIEQTCPECRGEGSREYALFEIEEAKELLKRCGMEDKT